MRFLWRRLPLPFNARIRHKSGYLTPSYGPAMKPCSFHGRVHADSVTAHAQIGPILHFQRPHRAFSTFGHNPKSFLSAGKVLARTGVAVGGTAAATLTYYQNKLQDWTDRVKANVGDFFEWIQSTVSRESSGNQARPQEQQATETTNTPVTEPEDFDDHATKAFLSTSPDDYFMALTRRLIEVRQILKEVGQDGGQVPLKLPAIVVIGSQSSGKSSLLEAIVGHEFLPKGNNMVTRRPIEITLVHTPDSKDEYAEFPRQQLKRVRDFSQVSKIIADLNAGVSEEECVSAEPIDLRIYSSRVPDLTLIDLPGYIAVENRNQPPKLRQKIVDVCRQYIKEPNVILAVCAADVDLANSEALNESRIADPSGLRTLGVLTKVDLVEPERTVAMLKTDDYPLQLGYLGVVCRGPATNDAASTDVVKFQRLADFEASYFRQHYQTFSEVGNQLGIRLLRRRLILVLEERMAGALTSIVGGVRSELDEARYQLKVQYNDREMTAESYVLQLLDELKQRLNGLKSEFQRDRLRKDIQTVLDKQIVQACSSLYWQEQSLQEMLKRSKWTDEEWQQWHRRFGEAQATFTTSGIGRNASEVVRDALLKSVDGLVATSDWNNHPDTRQEILEIARRILRVRFTASVEQIENSIKPYKFEMELTSQEWKGGLDHAVSFLTQELDSCEMEMNKLRREKHVRSAVQAVMNRKSQEHQGDARTQSNEDTVVDDMATHFTQRQLAKAREFLVLQSRVQMLRSRLATLQPGWIWGWYYPSPCTANLALAKQPSSSAANTEFSASSKPPEAQSKEAIWRPTRPFCPEPYLFYLSNKIAATATLFVALELLSEFFYQFPRDLDHYLRANKSAEQMEAFARQNEKIRRHLDIQKRKDALERAMQVLLQLQQWNPNQD